MIVELGNTAPHDVIGGENLPLPGPAVTTIWIPDDYTYKVAEEGAEMRGRGGTFTSESAEHLAAHVLREVLTGEPNVTHSPDQEAVISVAHAWSSLASPPGSNAVPPAWVWSDNEDFAVLLGHYFGCPVGKPDDVEDTHYTESGPPGVGPTVAA